MENGRKFAIGIGLYFVLKQVLNLVLDGIGDGEIFTLLLSVGYAVVLILGIRYCNYVVAALAALIAVYYLPGNITGLPGNWIYLLEGILDIGAAAILVFQKDVQAYFNKKA